MNSEHFSYDLVKVIEKLSLDTKCSCFSMHLAKKLTLFDIKLFLNDSVDKIATRPKPKVENY
jgi:hypothetical protein